MAMTAIYSRIYSRLWTSALLALLFLATAVPCPACQFCCGVSQTLTQEMESMDVVLIGRRLTTAPKGDVSEQQAQVPFEVAEILKGDKLAQIGQQITATHFGEGQRGELYLIMGLKDKQKIAWSTPVLVTPPDGEYLRRLTSQAPKGGVERLAYFYADLEHPDEMIARDAFDEFRDASYAKLQQLKPQLQHDAIVKWIQDTDKVSASRRRLYFLMLSVCGSARDLPLLEDFLENGKNKRQGAMDGALTCYLALGGEPSLQRVERDFLANPKADYADTYSAIMALRNHLSDHHAVPRERLLSSMRLMLKRPELADLVIPDLAVQEDWSVVNELFGLFQSSKVEHQWVRVPVVNYLRRCPLAQAKAHLRACERIDPAAIQRANQFFSGP